MTILVQDYTIGEGATNIRPDDVAQDSIPLQIDFYKRIPTHVRKNAFVQDPNSRYPISYAGHELRRCPEIDVPHGVSYELLSSEQ